MQLTLRDYISSGIEEDAAFRTVQRLLDDWTTLHRIDVNWPALGAEVPAKAKNGHSGDLR